MPGLRSEPWSFLEPLARELGFVAAGVSRAGVVPPAAAERFDSWIGAGLHGDMGYMSRHRPQRLDTRHGGIKEDARAVVVVALPYGDGQWANGLWRYVAAHARGRDYHHTMRARLETMAKKIQGRFPACTYRVFVDTAPVMERTWALSAGIGSLGRNGMVLVPGVGARVLLGEIVCAEVPAPPETDTWGIFDLCGECRTCIEACPTGALMSSAVVDCRRCLSYWTIEFKGSRVPREVAGATSLVFGCDICTSACGSLNAHRRSALEPLATWGPAELTLEEIGAMDAARLETLIADTPLERTGAAVIQRNAQLVLTHGNGGAGR